MIHLTLAVADIKHVEAFRSFLGSTHPVVQNRCGGYANGIAATLSVSSARLADRLASYGVTPRKTFSAKVVGLEQNPHFWRGVVDADGSLFFANDTQKGKYARSRAVLYLCGSKALVEQFAAFVQSHTGTQAKPHAQRSIWVFRVQGQAAVQAAGILYKGCSIALTRKEKIASVFLSNPKGVWRSRPSFEGPLH